MSLPKHSGAFHRSRLALLALIGSTGTVSFAATPVWSASGTVKNASNANLSGVAVTVKDSAAVLKTTTDGNGNFTIGTMTGIVAAPSFPTSFSVFQEGKELVVHYPAEGLLQLALVDVSGVSLWRADATLNMGVAHLPFAPISHRGAAILRVRQGQNSLSQPLTLDGFAGFTISPRPVAARSLAANPTLIFKKSGYYDTSYVLNSGSQSGITIVMRDTTPVTPVATTCTLPPSPAANGGGSFTWYYFSQPGGTFENGHYATACGYHGYEPNGTHSDTMQNIAYSKYFAAIPGSNKFNTDGMCGACVQLYNGSKSVIATITDECPTDNGNNPPCLDSKHLDLSYPAWSDLSFSVGNPSGTTWKYVSCPITGNLIVRLKPNDNAVYIENTILPIKSVSANGLSLQRMYYGCWQLSSTPKGKTLVITDYSNRTLTYTIPSSAGFDTNINTGLQFPACK